MRPFKCGCGRDWGCVEACTTISGLPQLPGGFRKRHPDHPLGRSDKPDKEKALSLRGLAQKGDTLANEIFDFQARALGLHVATCAMALDPGFVVIGGGLIDPDAMLDLPGPACSPMATREYPMADVASDRYAPEMNSSFQRLSLLCLILTIALVGLATSGCQTSKGFGKDVEKLGDKIQEKAD